MDDVWLLAMVAASALWCLATVLSSARTVKHLLERRRQESQEARQEPPESHES
jgi:hypothetical protein